MTRPTPPPTPALPPADALAPVAAGARSARPVRGVADRGPPGHHPARRAAGRRSGRWSFSPPRFRNPHTRAAYAAAVTRFFTWCDAHGLELEQISPIAVAIYIRRDATTRVSRPHDQAASGRHPRLFDWLVTGQVMPTNPATSVRGPTHVVRTGKTPVLQPAEARCCWTPSTPRPSEACAIARCWA